MARICKRLPTITLNTINRTDDPELLDFLNMVRDNQPDRESLFEFFLDRRWKCGDYDSILAAGNDKVVSSLRAMPIHPVQLPQCT